MKKGNVTENVDDSADATSSEKDKEKEDDKSEEKPSLLADLLDKLNPTYKTNTTDVSSYYVANENITLDKNISELTGVSKFVVSVFDEKFEEVIDVEYSSNGIDDMSKYIGANIEGTKTITEQVLQLKEEWGEPSIVAKTSAYAGIYWCFEKTAVGITVMDIGADDLHLSTIEVKWKDYDGVLADVVEVYGEDKFKGNPELKKDDETESNQTPPESETPNYEANLPSQVLLSYNGKSVSIFGKKANEILNELDFVDGVDYEAGDYSGGAVYTSCYYSPSNWYPLALDEKLYDEELKLWSIRLDYVIGVNVPEISLMGVKQGDTPADFGKIFGTCQNTFEMDGDYYYKYEVTIEGITMQVTICTEDENSANQERVKYIRIDEIKYN